MGRVSPVEKKVYVVSNYIVIVLMTSWKKFDRRVLIKQ